MTGEQSPMHIKQDCLTFLVKRKLHCALRTHEPPTDTARMLHNMHDARTSPRLVPILRGKSSKKFTAQASCGKQDSGHPAKVPARVHVHTFDEASINEKLTLLERIEGAL